MSKRKYTKMEDMEPIILTMRAEGRTRQEIANALGLEKEQVKDWIKRYNRRQSDLSRGIVPQAKGRPRKDGQPPRQDPQKEIERLRM